MNRLTTQSKSAAAIFISVLALAACSSGVVKNESPGPAAQATGLNPQQARITDERILSDRRTIDAVQLRMRKLNEAAILGWTVLRFSGGMVNDGTAIQCLERWFHETTK